MLHREINTPRGPGFNRRDFLKGSGAAVAATAMATAAHESAADDASQSSASPSRKRKITLNVNGKDHTLELESRVTLLSALRDDLNLTGCKDVDDRQATGADTVLIDGKPMLAGSLLAIQCEGKKILTVESLRQGDKVDEVITGFVKHDGMQCGFCTPGFVMATRACLNKYPNATADQIHKELGGNLCRCGTYHGIMQCALELAKKGGA